MQNDTDITQWRVDEFCSLGFRIEQAKVLAESKTDLAYTRDLIEHGCSIDLAYRIAPGTNFLGDIDLNFDLKYLPFEDETELLDSQWQEFNPEHLSPA